MTEKEAGRWKSIIKDYEESNAQLIQLCKKDAHVEYEAALNNQAASLEIQHKKHIENILRETKDQLEKMSKMYEAQINQQTITYETEKVALTKTIEFQTTEALNKIWDEKLKKSIQAAEQTIESSWTNKLSTEKEQHQLTKSSLTHQLSKLQDENTNHKTNLTKLQQELTDLKNQQVKAQEDFERTKSELLNKHKAEVEALLKDYKQKYESALNQLENAHQEMLQDCVNKVRTDLMNESEKHIQQLQQQSEIVINGLETSLVQCRQENATIEEKLKASNTKLENAEDALFDLKGSISNKDKEHSFRIWKLLAQVQLLKMNHKKSIEIITQQSIAERNQFTHDHEAGVAKLNAVLMKLIQLYRDVDKINFSVRDTIKNHKSDEIIDKRNMIREYHMELNKLDNEINILESQRIDRIEEIEGLQHNVKLIEEQIRIHNQESMIQNGRVNLAHGKKKKRLDEEVEKLLESIESKGHSMKDIDDKMTQFVNLKNSKELQLVNIEKALVEILVDQQRKILKLFTQDQDGNEKLKTLFDSYGLPLLLMSNTNNSLLQEDDD